MLPFASGVQATHDPRSRVHPRLVKVGDPVRYELKSESNFAPNWTVAIQVSVINDDGSVGNVISVMSISVQTLSAGIPFLLTEMTFSPGIYRIDLNFFDSVGAPLGNYFEYVEILPRTLEIDLGLSRGVVALGQTFNVRVENQGTREIFYDGQYGLERFREGRWTPVMPRIGAFGKKILLGAGFAGLCQRVRIPAHAGAGRYRILKRISYFIKRAIKGKTVSETFYARPGR